MKSILQRIATIFLLVIVSSNFTYSQENSRWKTLNQGDWKIKGEQLIQPVKFKSYSLDVTGLFNEFNRSEEYNVEVRLNNQVTVELPMPDGTMQKFVVYKTHVMHPDLAARYPDIKTFSGQGLTDPSATAVFDFTPFGFHAMIMATGSVVFIDPYSLQDTENYLVYYKRDFVTDKVYNCLTETPESLINNNRDIAITPGIAKSVGDELKTYRLAMACTGEYTAFYGGTVAGALAGIVTSVNRVTGIYEREFSIRMQLIANTDTLIFTNPSTDPYTNNNGGAMLGQNQTTVTNYIGGGNYDIGHVFSTGGGGIAGLGVVCNFSSKARGVTGSFSPINDPFDVDYVAHEIGHQFGGNHTFNCEVGACNGNRSFTTAYEPGSGSTIMAYAGICGSNNLQSNSDDYFHTKSFEEITSYTTTGVGANCPVITTTGNTPPVINPGSNYIIPYLTPFRLTGDATDPDGDPLTYCWEEYDLGPAGTWNNPVFNAPIFRSFDPTSNPTRLFPKLQNILNNNVTIGEILPSYARTLNFKLTVRDNKLNGGGVTNTDTPQQVQVIDTGTPFAVTSPNTTGVLWAQGSVETVTWDVGATDVAPISTPLVNILLSTDGGQTFPTILASQIPNNGTANVNVPIVLTTSARIMVEGDGNIFFDINDKNFEIGTVGISEISFNPGINVVPNPAYDQFEIKIDEDVFTDNFTFELTDIMGRLIRKIDLTDRITKVDVTALSSGTYLYRVYSNSTVRINGNIVID